MLHVQNTSILTEMGSYLSADDPLQIFFLLARLMNKIIEYALDHLRRRPKKADPCQ